LQARALLEMQRNAMLMFTSCGWFFDDINGLETRQILRYAGRALDLARLAGSVESADRAEAELIRTLAAARGRKATGDKIYFEERDGCRTDLRAAAAHVALGAAADSGRGRPLVPGAAFVASVVAEPVDRPEGESVTGTIEVEIRPLIDRARFEFVAARAADGRVLAGLWSGRESDGQSRRVSTVARILEALSPPGGAGVIATAGTEVPLVEPGPWMRPDARKEVQERSVRSEATSEAGTPNAEQPEPAPRSSDASSGWSEGAVPMSNPLVDGPLGWRLVRWSAALGSVAALLTEDDPDPKAIRNRSVVLRAWSLGPSAPGLASGHPSRRSARLQPALGGDVLTRRLRDRLERDVQALKNGSGDERRLLDRVLAALSSARTLGLHPDTWETQTLWWSYVQSFGRQDELTRLRERVGRKLGFE
ncbi:MAG: DUF3536 domain-containing protein, partial [Gemmatimonadota bacterium]